MSSDRPMSSKPQPEPTPAQLAETLEQALAQLRHAYYQLVSPDPAWDRSKRLYFSNGLLGPQIEKIERVAAALRAAVSPQEQKMSGSREEAMGDVYDAAAAWNCVTNHEQDAAAREHFKATLQRLIQRVEVEPTEAAEDAAQVRAAVSGEGTKDSAGLIGQPIPDMAGTEPRLNFCPTHMRHGVRR